MMSLFTGLFGAARRMRARGRLRRLSEAGYAAIMVALIVPTIGIACAAVAVDTGTWYVEMQMTQKAADAAALGGVPYLPQDFPSAKARALQVAARNGFDNTGNNTVTVELGDKATQLKVTISVVMKNTFGSAIGVNNATITRSGTADYQGPAPMGSPCNTFGNEPDAGTGGSSSTPSGSAQGASPYANCLRSPQYWATVEGPETGKVQGDRYQTKKCEDSGVDGCDSSKNNNEYDEFGYVFVVKVAAGAVNTPVNLQLYDPMFVNTGQTCSLLPDSTSFTNDTNNTNPYVKNNDAINRYSDDGATFSSYCTGDSYAGDGSGASPAHGMVTSYVLRQQTDTQNPKVAPVQNDTGGSACIKQFGSYNTSGSSISSNKFKSSSLSYDDQISSQFHNWTSLCTFTPSRAGDYYLQVRTNVSLGGTGSGYIYSGNTAAAAAAGNTPTGEGSNSFAIRAVTQTGKENAVAVSGYNHMPIFVNSNNASVNFNLIRVLPGAAGQKISFSYFDAGDADNGGQVQVLTPTDATGSVTSTPFPGGCVAIGGSAGSSATPLTNCTAPFQKDSNDVSRNNGKTETITIPIPADYTCNFASLGGCWYRVNIGFGGGGVHDVTTWDATVIGDPVRLIK
jgi:Flp pilus assembly protein TadG